MPGLRPTLGYLDAKAFKPGAMLLAKLDGGRGASASPIEITTVPRTRQQQTELLSRRPECWALMFFASELLLRRDALRAQFLDHEIGYAERNGAMLDKRAAISFLTDALHQTQDIGPRMLALFAPEVQRKALGDTSMSGDPDRISHLTSRIIDVYGSLLNWAARVRSVRAPDEMARAFELAARLVDSSVNRIHEWITSHVAGVEDVKRRYDAGEEIDQSSTLVLDIDEAVLAEFLAEMERLRKRPNRWWFDR